MTPNDPRDIRTFALYRLHTLKTRFTSIKTLPGFNITQHVENDSRHFSGGDMQKVVLKVESYGGLHLIKETLLSPDQRTLEQDGKYTSFEALVRNSYTFKWWPMKNANIFEIVAHTN